MKSPIINRRELCLRGISIRFTQGERSITADTALRLGRFSGMEAQFWLNLQSRYDLLRAEEALDKRLGKKVTPHAA